MCKTLGDRRHILQGQKDKRLGKWVPFPNSPYKPMSQINFFIFGIGLRITIECI